MKKVLAFIVMVFCCVAALVPLFSAANQKEAAAAPFDESELANIQEIMDINGTGFNASFLSSTGTPYDTKNEQPMPGKIFTPSQDEFNQFDFSHNLKTSLTFGADKSIYAYVYIPNSYLKDLTLSLYSAGGSISWTISSADLYSTLVTSISNINVEGWKLFEFSGSKISAMSNITSLNSTIFTQLRLSYKSPVVPTEKNDQTLSLYHIFAAESFSGKTRVIKSLSYYNYKFNEEFASKITNRYLYDELKVTSRSEVFECLYAGKTDMLSDANVSQKLQINIVDSESKDFSLKLGQTYVFEKEGWHTIIFKISGHSFGSNAISRSFYVEKFNVGYLKSSYRINKDQKLTITFDIARNFIMQENIQVFVDDKKVANATYYVEGNTCYITIDAAKEGVTNLQVTMTGKREGLDKVSTYTYKTKVYVADPGIGTFSLVVLWTFFALISIAFVVFLIISFVKARKFSVK